VEHIARGQQVRNTSALEEIVNILAIAVEVLVGSRVLGLDRLARKTGVRDCESGVG
jgi:hypothetical protein